MSPHWPNFYQLQRPMAKAFVAMAMVLLPPAPSARALAWPTEGQVEVRRVFSEPTLNIPLGDPCHVSWSLTPIVGLALEGLFLSEQYPDWLVFENLQARLDGQPVTVYLEIGALGEVTPGLRPHRFVFWDVESGMTDFAVPEGATLTVEFDLSSESAGTVPTTENGWFGRLQSEPKRAVGGYLTDGPDLHFGQTPLTLLAFEAHDAGDHIRLRWELHLEGETEQFRLQRGETGDPRNSLPLTAAIHEGPGDYSYEDREALPGREYWYWLAMLDAAGDVGRYLGPARGMLAGPTPPPASLLRNFPNPFNPRTTLRFETPEPGRVDLAVYDLRGRLLRHLAAEELDAGVHERIWDGRDDAGRELPSGSYFARLHRPGRPLTLHQLTLLR